jgi:ferredoxin
MFRIEIDRELCSGFASCVTDAPEIFELDSSGTAALRVAETGDERVLAAAAGCPMGAITVYDGESGDRVA